MEVAEFLREKLHKLKILPRRHLLGPTCVHDAKGLSDLFYAYVGTGQSVNQRKA